MKTLVVMGLAGALVSLSVFSSQRQQRQEQRDEWRSFLMQELDLTDKQAEKIKSIKRKYRPELGKLRKEKRQLKRELWDMTRKPKKGEVFQDELMAKHELMQKAGDAYDDKRFEMMLEAREALRPEQLANLDDVMKRKWRYHKWRHKRRSQQAQESASGKKKR